MPSDAQKLIEPDPRDVVPVSYPDTLDGWLAAWVLRDVARRHRIPMEMSCSNDQTLVLDGRNFLYLSAPGTRPGYVLDPSPDAKYRSRLAFVRGDVVAENNERIGRPLPFTDWKRTFPFGIETLIDGGSAAAISSEHALCRQVWDFFHADRKGFDKTPRLIQFVDDHVRARNALPDTPAVIACVESYAADFRTFDKLVEACDDRPRREKIIVGGQAILRYREKNGLVI